MKEVRSGLLIGDAQDAEAVLSSSVSTVTHLLSLYSSLPPHHDVPRNPLQQWHPLPHLTRLWVPWDDTQNQNILDTLELCLHFIDQGLQNGRVLVHCLAGVSRSAAVVIAHLMKSEHLPLEDALSLLRSINSSACPNYGFLDQLKLFESMGFTVDQNSHIYKRFRVEKLGELYSQGMSIESSTFAADPAPSTSTVSNDVGLQTQTESSESLVYRCKKCRQVVASQGNVLLHEQESGNLPVRKKDKASHWDEAHPVECTSIFVEPMQWMTVLQEGGVLGKLSCAGCNARLGSFNWSGLQCSCGSWVVPAFQLHKGRMDVSRF